MGEISKILILVSSRKNSKYLAKFLFGLVQNTKFMSYTEIMVMMNAEDEWNKEVEWAFSGVCKFMKENDGLGRAGLHVYFNKLLINAKSDWDWVIYFCDDHFVIMKDWDAYLRNIVEEKEIDPEKVYCLIPKFDNCGAMNQILSRGYVKALGNKVGDHGWIDSYINDLNHNIPEDRIIRFDEEMFHDFTHDKPNPMSEEHCQTELSEEGNKMKSVKYKSTEVEERILRDSKSLNEAIGRE